MNQAILRAVKWVGRLIFEHIGWKLLSLAAAVGIWAMVATEPELSTFASTQVEYKNLPEDIEIDSGPLATVTLELRGPSGALRDIGEANLRPQVILDMSGVEPGQRTFTIDGGSVKLPRGVELVRAVPPEVRFDFDRLGKATVPVVVPVVGQGVNGYVVASQRSEPARLSIVGPASHVAQIAQATTDPVDVSRAEGTVQYRVNAYLRDPYVQFQSSPQVEVTIVMKKKQ
jgi:YbbR domain-containing protein